MRFFKRGLAAACLLVVAGSAIAQQMDHSGHDGAHGEASGGAKPAGADSPSTEAFRKAAASMHETMGQTYTGDADRDFLAGMIPHHQGAIDMAKVVLKYGKDPKVRELAEAIVAAQEREIAEMRRMLDAQAKTR